MIFTETKLDGAFVIEPEPIEDERGFFARTWSQKEFLKHGLNCDIVEMNSSFNKRRGTLRGMHFQSGPHREAKVVRCLVGSIYDVIVDLRESSSTLYKWIGVELSAVNRRLLYVPEGFAHGFQTLEDNTEVAYQMSEFHHAESEDGLRWDDPALAIEWPLPVTAISQRDKRHRLLNTRSHCKTCRVAR
jgi:dTDP-4-dehydrorhamnose 3,5-epimerase